MEQYASKHKLLADFYHQNIDDCEHKNPLVWRQARKSKNSSQKRKQ